MSAGSAHLPPPSCLLWLARHTGFPASRLDARAEQLLLIGGMIQDEHLPVRSEGGKLSLPGGSPDPENAQRAAQRTFAELRKRVHFKCDNSAKV